MVHTTEGIKIVLPLPQLSQVDLDPLSITWWLIHEGAYEALFFYTRTKVT